MVVVMSRRGGARRDAIAPGGPPEAVRAAGGITVGVEEEFVLLDPSTGATVLAAPDLVRMLDGEPGVQPELMRFQVETATTVCTSLDGLGRELARLRRLVAEAAAQLGCRVVASGTAPFGTPGLAALTAQPRYRELARRYGPVAADSGTCGCHVHVGVPSRDLGVQVLARLRPWLAPLLAVTANSPIAHGHDTGWASWRYPIQARWPTVRAPQVWPDAAAYDAAVRRLIARGAALDQRSVYFLARLSPRYPTVEVRVADVCLDVGTTVLVAGLTRALVATALAEARQQTPLAAVSARQVAAAALDAAARHGLAGTGVDPFTGQAVTRTHSAPASSIMSAPPSPTAATPRSSPGCCTGSITEGPGPTGSGHFSPAPHRRPHTSRHSPAPPCPAASRPRAPGRCRIGKRAGPPPCDVTPVTGSTPET
jgi:glutamate---cysteine ligase / carboxylate-amine ligase